MARDLPHPASTASEWRRRLTPPVKKAWRAFDHAASRKSLVTPGVPILFFGDLDAYMTSRPRVLTVGKNPSSKEFPAGERFQRFPRLTGDRSDRKPGTYLKAMSDLLLRQVVQVVQRLRAGAQRCGSELL